MTPKKIPLRKCNGCCEMKPKKELIRVVKSPDITDDNGNIIENGNIFVARPPLFRIDAPARGRKPVQKLYALDDAELTKILERLHKEGHKDTVLGISRFKGLGEMSAEQLWETTLNPDTRRLLPVMLGDIGKDESVKRFQMLMGKGEAAARRSWMEEHGNEAETDI